MCTTYCKAFVTSVVVKRPRTTSSMHYQWQATQNGRAKLPWLRCNYDIVLQRGDRRRVWQVAPDACITCCKAFVTSVVLTTLWRNNIVEKQHCGETTLWIKNITLTMTVDSVDPLRSGGKPLKYPSTRSLMVEGTRWTQNT